MFFCFVYLGLQLIIKLNIPSFEIGLSFLGKISHENFCYSILVVKKKTIIKLQNTHMN